MTTTKMMSSPVREAMELIDVLANRNYDPDEDALEFVRADLVFSGAGSVRVIIADDVTVYAFDRHMSLVWDVRLTNAPLAALVAVIDVAESDAANAFDA